MLLKDETRKELIMWMRGFHTYKDFEDEIFFELVSFFARNKMSKAGIARMMKMKRTTLMERAKRLGLTYRGQPCEEK